MEVVDQLEGRSDGLELSTKLCQSEEAYQRLAHLGYLRNSEEDRYSVDWDTIWMIWSPSFSFHST